MTNSIDKLFGALTAPPKLPVQSIGAPQREVPQFAAAQPRALEGMSLPGKNPFGQISPVITNDKQGQKLPALYA